MYQSVVPYKKFAVLQGFRGSDVFAWPGEHSPQAKGVSWNEQTEQNLLTFAGYPVKLHHSSPQQEQLPRRFLRLKDHLSCIKRFFCCRRNEDVHFVLAETAEKTAIQITWRFG